MTKLTKISDPNAAAVRCQKSIKMMQRGFRADLYANLQNVYRISAAFADDAIAYQKFEKKAFWDSCKCSKPHADDDDETILFMVARFAFKAADTGGPRYNRVYKYARVLNHYASIGVPASKVAATLLADHGPERVYTSISKKVGKVPVVENDSTRIHNSNDVKKGDQNAPGSKGSGKKAAALTTSDRGDIKHVQMPDETDEPILYVKMSPKRLNRILGLEIGENATIEVTRTASDDNWTAIEATSAIIAKRA